MPVTDERATLLYLCCIVETATEAHALLKQGSVEGLESGQTLFAIERDDLVGAVARVSESVFSEEPLNALLADLPRLAPYAVRHEQAIAQLLQASPALIPMTFGAVYTGRSGIIQLLTEQQAELKTLLDRVRDRQEWGLKVFVDDARVREAALAGSDALRRLENETANATAGRAYLLGKRQERMISDETSRFCAQAVAEIIDRLGAASSAVQQDEVIPPSDQRPRLVAKAAFLVPIDGAQAFGATALELERMYGPRGLTPQVSGPWAPYSFVRLGREAEKN